LTAVAQEHALDELQVLVHVLVRLKRTISRCHTKSDDCAEHTFRRVSPPGAPDSSLGIASRRPRTRSGGVLVFVLKKFIPVCTSATRSTFERQRSATRPSNCSGRKERKKGGRKAEERRKAVAEGRLVAVTSPDKRQTLTSFDVKAKSSKNGNCSPCAFLAIA
jgi:hypothetical protein